MLFLSSSGDFSHIGVMQTPSAKLSWTDQGTSARDSGNFGLMPHYGADDRNGSSGKRFAWASENTGTPKVEIEAQITKSLATK
jgi:hypothetical protein